MAERGQNTQIIIGAASVDVTLLKTSSKPSEAQYETRQVTVGDAVSEGPAPDVHLGNGRVHPEADPTAIDPAEDFVPRWVPATMTRRGVTAPDGEWVDLTDELMAIDERTRIQGVRIECTVPTRYFPRMWMRDAYFIAPTNPESAKFLSYLWTGLMPADSFAVVRWTKRTGQYLGAILPQDEGSDGSTLMLVELEWATNMRSIPERAKLDVASVPEGGRLRAEQAMLVLRKPSDVLREMRDERMSQRTELLQSVRAGQTWTAPEFTRSKAADLVGDALTAAGR